MDLNTGLIIEGGNHTEAWILNILQLQRAEVAVRHRQDDFIPWKGDFALIC
jgi:hypothetical protein